jgi:serine/threonine protein kinase
MPSKNCQDWIDQAVSEFLGNGASSRSSDEFLTLVPQECRASVERLLDRIGCVRDKGCQQTTSEVVASEYGEIDFLGRGGMGSVFLARSQEKLFAIKIPQQLELQHFYAEIWNHVLLPPHPCLVNWKYLRQFGNSPGIVMEFMDRGSLANQLDQPKCYSEEQYIADFFDVTVQSCWALQHLHSKGLIHQDIKPENILFRSIDLEAPANIYRVGLADFGVSSFLRADTGSAHVYGFDARFAAPEQSQVKNASPATDVYCLGKTLQRLSEAKNDLVFHDSSCWKQVDAILSQMTEIEPETRISVDDVLEKMRGLYKQLTGANYPHQQPRVTNPVNLSDYILSILANPKSVFNEVSRLCPDGLSSLMDDWALAVQTLYASLFERHAPDEAAKVSSLLQIVFSRALNDGYFVPIEELDSIAKSAEMVMQRFSGIQWPASYSLEFASAATPLLVLLSQFNVLDPATSAEVEEILETLTRLQAD